VIIFGWRSGGDVEWYGLLQCEQCGEWAFHQGIRVKRTFTLFFIPILPLWSDTKVFCTICGNQRKVGPQEYQQLAEKAAFYRRLAVLAREDPAKFEAVMRELRQDADLAESSTAPVPELTAPYDAPPKSEAMTRELQQDADLAPIQKPLDRGSRILIVGKGTSVYDRPDLRAGKMAYFPAGLEVNGLEEVGDFFQVASGGMKGYVPKSSAKLLGAAPPRREPTQSSTAPVPELTARREAGHTCESCGLTSDLQYKFCIHCGTPFTGA